jgi:copper chaperone CopZ
METVTLNVPDISCEHCAKKIMQALANVPVSNLQVNVPAKQVTFQYANERELALAKSKLVEIGYPAS